jgi:5-formyltetrahydrofolate cyclo-ligase
MSHHPVSTTHSQSPIASTLDRSGIRRSMRSRRSLVGKSERAAAAAAFAQHVARARLLRPGLRVALYCSYGHEADTSEVIALARQRGCELYLPRIVDYTAGRMQFVHFKADATLRTNRYGIPEPVAAGRFVATRALDLIFLPVVAFDSYGGRLGSGAGFYDRRLARLRSPCIWHRPKLVGVAYEFQRVAQIDSEPWDIPMDAVITEKGYHAAFKST